MDHDLLLLDLFLNDGNHSIALLDVVLERRYILGTFLCHSPQGVRLADVMADGVF